MTEKTTLTPGEACPTCGHVVRKKRGFGFLVLTMLLGGILGCAGGFYFVKTWFGPDNYFYPMGIVHEMLFSAIGVVVGLVAGLILKK